VDAIGRYAADGGNVLGICGGYQMLGRQVHDPDGIEGKAGSTPGLGLLPVETVLKAPKTTTVTAFSWEGIKGKGYEIHMGQTQLVEGSSALLTVESRNQAPCHDRDGCISEDGKVLGTYVHGLFDAPKITRHWLWHIGLASVEVTQEHGPAARDEAYQLLAEHMVQHVDVGAILGLARHSTE
jgi:adenosylcobyric acid synthase